MKVKWYETRKRWRLIVPARFTGTGKKQFILFKSKSDGEAEIRRILNRGSSSKPQITEADEAALTLAKDEGLGPQQMLDAIRLYKQQVLGISKKATLQEAQTLLSNIRNMSGVISAPSIPTVRRCETNSFPPLAGKLR